MERTTIIKQQNEMTLYNYSTKAIALTGTDYAAKETIMKAGGKFNRYLKIDGKPRAGWIFSKKRLEEVKALIEII